MRDMNCLSVFDHFVGLAFKGLKCSCSKDVFKTLSNIYNGTFCENNLQEYHRCLNGF